MPTDGDRVNMKSGNGEGRRGSAFVVVIVVVLELGDKKERREESEPTGNTIHHLAHSQNTTARI